MRPDYFEMGPIGCRETSLKRYDSTLRETPRERRSHIYCPLVRLEVSSVRNLPSSERNLCLHLLAL